MYGYRPTQEIQATSFGELRKRTEERLGQLVAEFQAFAKARFAVKWDEGTATDAIAGLPVPLRDRLSARIHPSHAAASAAFPKITIC